ncbi:hypothetical protein EDE04_2076 [Streptomyces sp. 2132.2]|uniref:hypothetical protein n=1 Tax=Streptomyces sp. 2132.2 TaxID=2485161 RepID=UPI000F96D800|nr:hypothetical protein [Streptomyces sp. 2132.2]ROQ95625.1 hypothetical protein EDE04_2076 [Streptomyces sp. 2132.2]
MDTTKTADPTAPETDTAEPRTAEAGVKDASAAESAEAAQAPEADLTDEDLDDELDESEARSEGVGSAAAAVVAAGLGLVALSGSWVSRVIAERQTLVGQIESVNAATTEAKIEALYGDAWHMTALVNGVLSTLALLLAVFVLARPAFGAPGRTLPTWVRAVSWAAVALGALGVLLFGLMYFDILAPLPKAA